MRQALPFRLRGIDSGNGSELIDEHLVRDAWTHPIQSTRGRSYKKDDNAHIEQKNWSHVRKLIGWDRFNTPEAVERLNDHYRSRRDGYGPSPAPRTEALAGTTRSTASATR